MRCASCGGEIRTPAEHDWHTYRHLQEFWPDRDYSRQIRAAEDRMKLEQSLKVASSGASE